MSKSIRVFTEVGVVYPLTEYSYELESDSANLYKVRIGRDNKPIVIFGNGVWGKFNALVDNMQLYYLQATYNDCDVSRITTIEAGTQTLDSAHFTILASTKGREATLEDLRKQYKGVLSTPLVTELQIRNYVNQFSSVSDCSPVHTNGLVTVYIKPTDIYDSQFGDIQERLSINGNFLQFQCVAAHPYNFDILIKPYGAVSLNTQIQIVTEIKNLLRYDLVKFDTQISIQMLNEIIQKYSISASVSLQIKEVLETLPYQMSTVPAKKHN